ncbi:GNAT family N-acetyltransferase [Dyadobacter sediminis]|uniref:GNAT family N-acetyltransferase n=1 Tax=Dyadobacter sediminis TaxID=1493691 RepID=A0A5R9KFN1_9BACT|nr:GNAT family N-acetyltransferase [Dyadobacter sediminis]TLU94858.1 GNAT family N-acetyltransferase [Dyadobacter sediminis]GGB87361.1 N-acetyltransferase [Dyadobacter sediminis]
MIILKRTDSDNPDFISLVKLLDAYLAVTDGDDHSFYSQYNKVDKIRHVVLAYENEKPVGCGAIKVFEDEAMEVKRMYVSPECRNKGIAGKILSELESWAGEMSFKRCVLETGKRQPDAIALYKKCGYRQIPNYGQYINVENSICFEKLLSRS